MATRPTFNPHDQDRLLRAMGEARRELCDAAIKMQSRSLTKAGAETVIGNIDEMAFLLTGYRKFYQGNRRTARLGPRRQRRRRTIPSNPS